MHEGEDEEVVEHEILEETGEISVPEAQLERPVFILPLKDETLMEGQDLRMEAHVRGNPAPTIQWFVDDEVLTPSDDIEIIYEEGRCLLSIRQMFFDDEGEYWVEATNEFGTATTSSYVTVLRKYTLCIACLTYIIHYKIIY